MFYNFLENSQSYDEKQITDCPQVLSSRQKQMILRTFSFCEPLQHALIHEADSEDSEDEWNYYPVDPNKEKGTAAVPIDIPQESKNEQETDIIPELPAENVDCLLKIQSEDTEEDIKCGSPKTDTFELINTEISAEDRIEKTEEEETAREEEQEKPKDMDFQLNPDAAEFIPVSPQFIGGARVNLAEDYPVSGSPFKQVPEMDDIQVPSQSEFEKEVCQRPREVEVEEKKEYQNGEHLQSTDYTDFLSDQQKTVGVPGNLDDSEISSTKAEFGDESGVSFLTTSEFHRTGFSTIDESFSSSERDYDIAKDPMAMSFTPSDFEAAFDKGVDLNAVHDLSNTDLDEKNGAIEKEENVTEESPLELQLETTDLMVVPEAEEPAEDKLAFSEEPTKLVNLSLEQENTEEATFIEYTNETKTSTEVVDLLQLQPESSQIEQLEIARYDHSPSTENYSAEFESEKEPISVDNEQPLSPSSADIDETKPIDETSEDAVLPESDLQKEACPSEIDTPSSLSPVPGPLESESVDPTKNAEIQSLLHADAPEFLPRQYNLQSHDVETSSEVSRPTSAEAADPGRKSPIETANMYELQSLKTDNAFESIQRDSSEKEMNKAMCTKPPAQENLLDFEEEAEIKPTHIESELTLPSFSPQQMEKESLSSFDDLVCPIKKPSTVTDEYKSDDVMQLKETPEKTTVFEDKTENITTGAMEPLVELTKPEGLMDAAEERPVLNLSESMQEFTGLENQLQPETEETATTIAEPSVVEKIHEELKKEELKDLAESEEHLNELEIEKELHDIEKEKVEQVIFGTELKEPEIMKELETKELETNELGMMKELETKELEIMGELETKEPETIEKSEAKELKMMNELETKESEMMKELETKETEMMKELETKETEMAKELEVKEPEIVKDLATEETTMVKELVVEESEMAKEPEMINKLKVNELETTESEVKEPEITKELETKEVEMVKEPEAKEPEIMKELETKAPEIIEKSETKVPETTEVSETKVPEIIEKSETKVPEIIEELETKAPEIIEVSETKKPEMKEEAPEVNEGKVEETAVETSENKAIDAAATTLAAAAVSTAAVAAGTAVAQSKSKVKTTGTKAVTKTTGQKVPPKSTQTSPSKSAISATRTSTAAAKKPSTTMPARPKDLDTSKKSTVLSSASSKTSTTVPKSGSKITTSTGVTKTTTKTSVTSKPKPSATTASSKPIATEKKPTANGDVKSLNKAAATKPTSKPSSTSKSPLTKTSTSRPTAGSTTARKLKSNAATTKSSTTIKSSTSSPSTTSIVATNTAPAKAKTTPTVGNATTKPRTPTTAKSPVIDKQVKETANKQISMSRTSIGSKASTRLFTSSSTTTTTKRVSSTTKTSTTASPTKKITAVSKVSSKTSTTGKTITEKGKILQNGVSEKVEINAIFDDVPQKDLSPVVAPNDNQLIMSSD
ncbi:hypothetical protein ANTQUA_LOCUS585 [Anthophora quadrimaculata]